MANEDKRTKGNFDLIYQNEKLVAEVDQMKKDFSKINKTIYAAGLVLGSDEYFKVREICCKHQKI